MQTNLTLFAAEAPAYLSDEIVGPAIVPCYVGWYFTVVLGNGSVLPCCQCTEPIDQVSKERSFADVWASQKYGDFRAAQPGRSRRRATASRPASATAASSGRGTSPFTISCTRLTASRPGGRPEVHAWRRRA